MMSLSRGRVSLLGRVYVLVAVLIVLLGVVSVGTVVFRQRGETATTRLTTEIVPAQMATSGLTAAYVGQASAVRGFLATRDPALLGAYMSRMADVARSEGIIRQQMAASPRVMSSLDEVRRVARGWRQHSEPTMREGTSQGSSGLPQTEAMASQQRFEVLRADLATLQKRVNEIAASQTAKAAAARAATDWLVAGAGVTSVVVAAGALLFLRRSLTCPLRTLVSQVNQVAEGDRDRPVGEVGPPELSTVARAVETMRRRILDETLRREQIQQDLARHEAAERRRAEQDYATVVAALDEGVIVVDSAGTIESANPAAQRVCGTSESELVGSAVGVWPLFDEAGATLEPEDLPSAMTRRSGVPENARVVYLQRADGHDVWLSVTSRALTPQERPPQKVVVSFTDITESRAVQQRLEYEATHDPLTGLANRTLILRHLEHARQQRRTMAVLYLDLDNFKRINDSLGHSVGDDVLRLVGHRLVQTVAAETVVGRLGGDEFVLLTAEGDHTVLAALIQRLLEALAQPLQIQARQLHVQGHLGIAVSATGDTRTDQDLLRDADVAMYQAKTRGSGHYAYFDVELREHLQRHMTLEQDLRHAVSQNQLWVAYQPVVDLRSMRTVAVEGLLRWTHPTHGTISPGEFIPIAEESDLIHHVGAHMLRTATRQLAAERKRDQLDLRLNANLSPRQLEDPDLHLVVQSALTETALPAGALCLEVTEEAIIHDPAQATRVLNELRELGVSLAIDDFGTGYSSLAQLRHLPLDTLKIDRSFVTDLGNSRDLEAIVTSIIAMAHAVGLDVVAEGVETVQQLELLTRLGCDHAQGYHLGKPAPIDELTHQD